MGVYPQKGENMIMPLDLPRIIKELNLDVPIYRVRALEDRVELYLYGGKIVTWKPSKSDRRPVTSDHKNLAQDAPVVNFEIRKSKKGRVNK